MRFRPGDWWALLRPGDVLVVLAGLLLCGLAVRALWQGGAPDGAVVRAGGQVVAEVDLSRERFIEVPGPLGVTLIEIQPGRARVASDPGPRQYCVRQGWLTQAGAVAICAPNEVSLSLTGRAANYDSLNY
ncbi:MAG TPA: NusG domain II-containing protein [Thauera sp.]|uniref:NusG domain II-containing protein n=1 Tax=Thauera sp. TaxID=1905334 RepID=UPI002CDB5DA8|nr:NusG domain II-containing protein [Thauera sp.]HRP22463.1 NusG domain II-containing protein [Thauera sp.]HRP65810.1 NusG domain II-containing protein [Thauera sp.]